MRTALLFIPSLVVVLAFVWHSLVVRGRRETLIFFSFGLLFGILRGNIIWWITTVHFGGRFPYIFKNRLFGFFHDSLQADIGWILTLYLGYCFAERALRASPSRDRSLWHIVSIAALFAVCLSYAVESTAMALGWWNWNLGVKSRFWLDVPVAGVAAWFSVPCDFLLAFLLWVRGSKRARLGSLFALAVFPLHMLVHLSNERVSSAVPVTPFNLWYWVTALLVFALPFGRSVLLKPYPTAPPRWTELLPGFGIGVVLCVLLFADLFLAQRPLLLVSLVPLALFVAHVYWRWGGIWILGLSLLGALIGGRLFWLPAVVSALLLLWTKEGRFREPIRRGLAVGVPLLATVLFLSDARARDRVDREYTRFCVRAQQLAQRGELEASVREFERAQSLRPHSVRAFEGAALVQVQRKDYGAAEKTYQRLLELRPISPEVMHNLGNVYLLRGERERALGAYRKALEFDPNYPAAKQSIARLDAEPARTP